MKTLRIINQHLEGCEERRNICLGSNNYNVVMKVENNLKGDNFFALAMKQHYNDENIVDETIVGFVQGITSIPIRKHEVAYIVNEEGKTIERIYGIYEKH